MQTRRLGRAGPVVSALGLGCMSMTEVYGPAGDEAESIATIRRAIDCGCTLIDTADIYGQNGNEVLVGVLAQGDDIIPIPGTKRRRYLDENFAALEIEMAADDRRALDRLVPRDAVAGERYLPALKQFMDS